MNCTICQHSDLIVIKNYQTTHWFLCKHCLALFRFPVGNIKDNMAMNISYHWGHQRGRSEDDFQRSVSRRGVAAGSAH